MLKIKGAGEGTRWEAEDLAKVLAGMLVGRPDEVWPGATSASRLESGPTDRWQIGAGDNYWLHVAGNGGFTLNARYAWSPEDAKALARVLRKLWDLDVAVEVY